MNVEAVDEGVETYEITTPKGTFYVSSDSIIANVNPSDRTGNYQLYVNTDDYLEIYGNGDDWYDIYFNGKRQRTREIAKWAYDHGYPGVVIRNVSDSGGSGYYDGGYGDLVISFDSERIKSADLVTYDDNGKIIPLNKRFNAKNNDIRYSLKSEIDPRMYLASALLDNIKNAEDRKTLEEYKATYNERKGLYRQLDGLKADLETATDPEKVKADMSKVRKQIRTLEDKLNSVMTMPRMQSIIKEQREDIERYRWALLEQGEKADKERARLEKKLGTFANEIRRRMEKKSRCGLTSRSRRASLTIVRELRDLSRN